MDGLELLEPAKILRNHRPGSPKLNSENCRLIEPFAVYYPTYAVTFWFRRMEPGTGAVGRAAAKLSQNPRIDCLRLPVRCRAKPKRAN